jgi:hypothetical protein
MKAIASVKATLAMKASSVLIIKKEFDFSAGVPATP